MAQLNKIIFVASGPTTTGKTTLLRALGCDAKWDLRNNGSPRDATPAFIRRTLETSASPVGIESERWIGDIGELPEWLAEAAKDNGYDIFFLSVHSIHFANTHTTKEPA